MFFDLDQQLLVYIRVEKSVGNSRVVNTIQMNYSFLYRRRKLVMSISTGSVTNDINGNIIHTFLRVNNKAKKNYQCKINIQ